MWIQLRRCIRGLVELDMLVGVHRLSSAGLQRRSSIKQPQNMTVPRGRAAQCAAAAPASGPRAVRPPVPQLSPAPHRLQAMEGSILLAPHCQEPKGAMPCHDVHVSQHMQPGLVA